MREFLKPYALIAKIILAVVSVLLVSYGIYDQATLEALIGSLTGIATAFWQAYDKFTVKSDKESD